MLPADARFCHRCGQPQFAEDIARIEAVDAAAGPVQGPLAPPLRSTSPDKDLAAISFNNTRAVFTTLIVAAVSMVVLLLIALHAAPLFPFFLCGVGYVAVRFYRGKSAEPLSTSAGARLGWMTGLWLFIVVVVLLTLTAISISNPEVWKQLQESYAKAPQVAKLLTLTQHDLLMQILFTVPFWFLLLTILPGLGGMLAAKFPARRRST